jgi:hypothetical protein
VCVHHHPHAADLERIRFDKQETTSPRRVDGGHGDGDEMMDDGRLN